MPPAGSRPRSRQAKRRELHLHRAPPPEHVDVGDRRGLEPLIDVVGNLGGEQVFGVLCEHAGDIECDVSVSDHRDIFCVQRPGPGNVRVTVIPAHKIGRPITALEINSRDIQLLVFDRASRENHRVIVPLQILERDVGAVIDVSKQADRSGVQDFPERCDDALNAGVVGGHTVADETIGCRKTLEQVDRDVKGALVFEQDVGGINAGRSCAHDGKAQLRHTTTHSSFARGQTATLI